MNRERAKELLPIIQAFADGEEIEWKGGVGICWRKSSGEFADNTEYRIKPKEPREFWIHPRSAKSCIKNDPGTGAGYFKVREVLDE